MAIGIAVLGATGKMGKRILELAFKDPQICIKSATGRGQPNSSLGSLLKETELKISLTSDPLAALLQCDVGIDFTHHLATIEHLNAALVANKPLVIGTTGHSQDEKSEIEKASRSIPILYSPNFSFGMALCLDAVSRFGKALFGKSLIDIVETHHIHKKDSPSGTALALANAVGDGKVATESALKAHRNKEEILVHSIRQGDVIGEHTVIFECGIEKIELKHTCHSRDAFAQGALMGAKFLAKQSPGLYSLKNLFGSY